MRQFGILLALAGTLSVAAAQTNTATGEFTVLPPAQTNRATTNPVYQASPYSSTNVAGEASPATSVRRMSLEDCIELALKNNLDLKIDRINPDIARYALGGSYGYYDPIFGLSGEHSHSEQGSQAFNFLRAPSYITDYNNLQSSLGGSLPWGTTYSFQGNMTDTESAESTSGSASVKLTQPLLKNFWIDAPRLSILVAKNRVKYSEQVLRQQVMQTITALEQAYYLLIYDQANVEVQQKAVALAEQLVTENRRRLEVGSLAPLDLESAESQAAQSRAALLQAQIQLGTQERVVKRFITDHFLDWAEVAIEPTGTLTAPPPTLSRQESWRKGLNQRPEMVQAKLDLEKQGVTLKYDRNQLYPEVDLFGTYGYNGSGKVFSDAFYDLEKRDRPSYSYGAQLSVPLSRVSARATYSTDRAANQQLELTLQRLQETILVEIDNDIGTIRAAYDQVKATHAATQYAAAALDAEQKKLESGKSTTYTVLQMQRDLTAARGNEIQALDNYNDSLSQLSLDEASTFERLKIRFEVK